MTESAILALEDGSIFRGVSVGAKGIVCGEVVFNTAMTGYQEILSDPSYSQQIVALTYPHIGNTGTTTIDQESNRTYAKGLLIRDLSITASNWRYEQSLEYYLKENNIIAISEIDTRHLTRILREKGVQNGCMMSGNCNEMEAIKQAKNASNLCGMDLVKDVTTQDIYSWKASVWSLSKNDYTTISKRTAPLVVAYDFGIKRNILRLLTDVGLQVTVVPADTSAQDVLAMKPAGVFLSNGPGDPAPCTYAIKAITTLLEMNIPLFGICLGHQLLALASGATTEKMKFGHHGANHPVQDLATKKVMITSQNHGFSVAESSMPTCLRVTHRSLFDNSIQGIERIDKPAFGFQGHPEASPGPQDITFLFKRFFELIQR